MNISGDEGRMKVECSSSHLTAFAVLVDVSGSISVSVAMASPAYTCTSC